MSRGRRLMFIVSLTLLLLVLDQATKQIAIAHLRTGRVIAFPSGWYPHDLFHFRYAENTGAFLSLGSGLSDGLRFWLLTGLNVVILGIVGALLVFRKEMTFWVAAALTLILAGGLGNLIDRIMRDGIVVDFMNMGIRNLRTGVFNIADVAIMGGLFLLLFLEFFCNKKRDEKSGPVSA